MGIIHGNQQDRKSPNLYESLGIAATPSKSASARLYGIECPIEAGLKSLWSRFVLMLMHFQADRY